MTESTEPTWRDLPGWHAVHIGLRAYFKAMILSCVLVGVMILVMPIVAMSGSLDGIRVVGIVTGLLGTAVSVLALWGLSKYAKVPEQTGGRSLAQVAYILSMVGLAIGVFSFVRSIVAWDELMRQAMKNGPFKSFDPLTMISLTVNLSMLVAFLLSMGRVASYVERHDIRKLTGITIVVLGAVAALGLLVFAMMAGASTPQGLMWAIAPAFIALGLAIWMLVNIMIIHYRLSKAVGEGAANR